DDGIRDFHVTGVQTCALPIYAKPKSNCSSVLMVGSVASFVRVERCRSTLTSDSAERSRSRKATSLPSPRTASRAMAGQPLSMREIGRASGRDGVGVGVEGGGA